MRPRVRALKVQRATEVGSRLSASRAPERSSATMRRASLLTLLLAASCAAKSKTQYEDKPPGWRPDKPTETAIEIVDRLLRKLKRYGDYPSGPWFYLFQES